MNNYMIRIEALLFAAGDGISYSKLADILELDKKALKDYVKQLKLHYDRLSNALEIVEYADKIQISIRAQFMPDIEKLHHSNRRASFSKSAIEVLSIVAYNQNITKASIDHIRGVNSDRAIAMLINEGWIKAIKDPNNARFKNYVTTDQFLKRFGLKNLKELPQIDNMERLQMKLGEMVC